MCNLHYLRMHRTGSTYRRNTVQRFWAMVDRTGDCWLWTGSTRNGYGQFYLGKGDIRYAHRYAYELVMGPISGRLRRVHGCVNRLCVRPAHLH